MKIRRSSYNLLHNEFSNCLNDLDTISKGDLKDYLLVNGPVHCFATGDKLRVKKMLLSIDYVSRLITKVPYNQIILYWRAVNEENPSEKYLPILEEFLKNDIDDEKFRSLIIIIDFFIDSLWLSSAKIFSLKMADYVKNNSKFSEKTKLQLKLKISQIYYAKGEYDKSEIILKEVIDETKVIEENVKNLLTLNVELGNVLLAKGDYKSTESFCREMIKENEKELGVDHELILGLRSLLCKTLLVSGGYKEAVLISTDLRKYFEQIFGENHPKTIESMLLNAKALDKHKSDTGTLYNELSAIQEKYLGREHPDTINLIAKLEGLKWAQEKRLSISEKTLGVKHPKTIKIKFENLLITRGKDKEKKLLDIYNEFSDILGEDHPESIEMLGSIFFSMEGLLKSTKGKNPSRVIIGRSGVDDEGEAIAVSWDKIKRSPSYDIYTKFIKLAENKFGMLHPVVAESYYERDNYPGIFSKLFSGSNKNKISKDDHLAVLLKSYDIKSEYIRNIFYLDYDSDDWGDRPLPEKLGRFLKKICNDEDFEYIQNTIFTSKEEVEKGNEAMKELELLTSGKITVQDLRDKHPEEITPSSEVHFERIEGSFLTIWDGSFEGSEKMNEVTKSILKNFNVFEYCGLEKYSIFEAEIDTSEFEAKDYAKLILDIISHESPIFENVLKQRYLKSVGEKGWKKKSREEFSSGLSILLRNKHIEQKGKFYFDIEKGGVQTRYDFPHKYSYISEEEKNSIASKIISKLPMRTDFAEIVAKVVGGWNMYMLLDEQILNMKDGYLYLDKSRDEINDKTDEIIKFYEIHDLLVNTTLKNLEIINFHLGADNSVDEDNGSVKIDVNEKDGYPNIENLKKNILLIINQCGFIHKKLLKYVFHHLNFGWEYEEKEDQPMPYYQAIGDGKINDLEFVVDDDAKTKSYDNAVDELLAENQIFLDDEEFLGIKGGGYQCKVYDINQFDCLGFVGNITKYIHPKEFKKGVLIWFKNNNKIHYETLLILSSIFYPWSVRTESVPNEIKREENDERILKMSKIYGEEKVNKYLNDLDSYDRNLFYKNKQFFVDIVEDLINTGSLRKENDYIYRNE